LSTERGGTQNPDLHFPCLSNAYPVTNKETVKPMSAKYS
jgi:hypothetical protein